MPAEAVHQQLSQRTQEGLQPDLVVPAHCFLRSNMTKDSNPQKGKKDEEVQLQRQPPTFH